LRATIHWYRQNQEWVKAVRNGEYLNYYKAQYGLNLPAGQVV
jgi:dTDP-D-glucose 4,6-dehydratase